MRGSTLLFLCSLTAMGCSQPAKYVSTAHGPEKVVAVWVDPQSELPLDATMEGCNLWNVKDVQCVVARNPLESDVVIVADHHFCGADAEKVSILAEASSTRVIAFRTDCFYSDMPGEPKFKRRQYSLVVAHEVGHTLGIWGHVPDTCKPESPHGPDGTQICGSAILNSSYQDNVGWITPADAAAYDVCGEGRFRDHAAPDDSMQGICNYVPPAKPPKPTSEPKK